MHPLRRSAPLALAALLAWAGAAPAQHGMASGPRPLHLRLAAADVVAIATVADVRPGRVALRDAIVLHGEAPPAFELKRAPSREIPYAVGLRLVLPLRGARSPYVLEDDARELVVLRDDAAVAAWSEALRALLAAGGDREALTTTYLGWLDGGEEGLREVAAAALVDPRSALLPLSPERTLERAHAALDPALPAPARRVSAILAGGRPEGTRALLDAALADPAADPQVVETVLRDAVAERVPGADDALVAALGHGSASVRRAAVRLAGSSGSPAALARLPALATSDPDEGVRRQAAKVMTERGSIGAR